MKMPENADNLQKGRHNPCKPYRVHKIKNTTVKCPYRKGVRFQYAKGAKNVKAALRYSVLELERLV